MSKRKTEGLESLVGQEQETRKDLNDKVQSLLQLIKGAKESPLDSKTEDLVNLLEEAVGHYEQLFEKYAGLAGSLGSVVAEKKEMERLGPETGESGESHSRPAKRRIDALIGEAHGAIGELLKEVEISKSKLWEEWKLLKASIGELENTIYSIVDQAAALLKEHSEIKVKLEKATEKHGGIALETANATTSINQILQELNKPELDGEVKQQLIEEKARLESSTAQSQERVLLSKNSLSQLAKELEGASGKGFQDQLQSLMEQLASEVPKAKHLRSKLTELEKEMSKQEEKIAADLHQMVTAILNTSSALKFWRAT